MKILTVVGARPQFIKAAVVSRAIKEYNQAGSVEVCLKEVIVHTGQHYDENMSDIFFEEMGIPKPDYNLGVGSGLHGAMTGRMLEKIEEVIFKEKPDIVMVYGDTNSTLAGALAAVKLHIPVAHVEAGLRSFNRRMPEEINRVLTDHAADILFSPTETAVVNLCREGIPQERIHLVGDVMYDAALYYGAKAEEKSCVLERLGLKSKGYILATVHRAENTNDFSRLQAIFRGLIQANREVPVVMPLHPRTRATLTREGLLEEVEQHLQLIGPVGYLDMLMLEKNARLIVTDSGGVQKEAFFYRVPCVTLRDETEWVELIELGWNKLAPPYSKDTVSAVVISSLEMRGNLEFPYGCGETAKAILSDLKGFYKCDFCS